MATRRTLLLAAPRRRSGQAAPLHSRPPLASPAAPSSWWRPSTRAALGGPGGGGSGSGGALWAQVTVDDDGPGIPAADREGAFRPFRSGAPGGTGLGLAIARDIVRAHGGDLMLEESPLGGLRARLRLPV